MYYQCLCRFRSVSGLTLQCLGLPRFARPTHPLVVNMSKRSYMSPHPVISQSTIKIMRRNCRVCIEFHPNSRQFSHVGIASRPTSHSVASLGEVIRPTRPNHNIGHLESKIENVTQKLLFNSVIEASNMKEGWLKMKIRSEKDYRRAMKNSLTADNSSEFPIALKYLIDDEELKMLLQTKHGSIETDEPSNPALIQLPYGSNSCQETAPVAPSGTVCNGEISVPESRPIIQEQTYAKSPSKSYNWMMDYDLYPDREEDLSLAENDEEPWQLNYGTTDPNVPVSNVPCGGCGALLHCQDMSIPGYLPSELFSNRKDVELRTITCQRCHFLKFYDTALAVNVSADEYPRLLAQIQDKKALAILMVDLMDFPCSIWPNILDIIGTKRPVVVVGNKVDLLPQDSPGFLNHIESVLTQTLEQTGLTIANIKHVALISAKTGFGVDQLITKLQTSWEYNGDVFLIGCTNVGKSTLFNALLQSDYCKVKAVDLIQRATTSPWPGTTLNLLKFPILRPDGWRMYVRTQRLIAERKGVEAEKRLRQHQAKKTRTAATLMGHIGRTFRPEEKEVSDPFAVNTMGQTHGKMMGLDPKDRDYVASRWCYDTPGTVQPDQVINLLTTKELMRTLPKMLLHPRTFSLVPGSSLFLAGLGRLDYVSGSKAIRFTVMASEGLPLTVSRTRDADEVYSTLLGSELFAVPSGGEERLAQWPRLMANTGTIEVTGEDWKSSCADVVLSSAGWVAVTPGPGMVVELQAWTPEGRGIYVRPPLLPHAVNHRGARLRRSPAYKKGTGIYSPNLS